LRKIEIMNDNATLEWLDTQKGRTRYTYKNLWRYFLEYTGLTGDQILGSRKADTEYAWEKKVLDFKDWVMKNKGVAISTATTATKAVRGFFSYHRSDLKFRRGERVRLSEAQRKTEDYRFSREDLKKMCDFADLPEKYIITAGKSFGFRAGDFIRLTRGDLEPYIDRPVPISIGEFTTQKEKVKAYPFIDSDAQPIIKLMLEKMDREGRTQPTDRILKLTNEIQLTRTLKRLTTKAGIKYGNKQIRFHNLRKFLCDRLASHMSESKWKLIVGKKISEGAYVGPDTLKADYQRAMADTTFTTDLAEIQRRQEILEKLQLKMVTGEPLDADDKANIAKYQIRLTKKIPKKKEILESAGAARDDSVTEQFGQIPEEKLLAYLKDGWQIVHRLSNGDIVVRR
jgi:hypothetical protein